jgi:sensor domain CHASE-containing protein
MVLMIDVTQLLLAFVILVLTGMLTVIGIQVYFILREFRNTLQKTNKVLDDTGVISQSISRPVSMISSIMMGLRGGTAIVKALTKNKK